MRSHLTKSYYFENPQQRYEAHRRRDIYKISRIIIIFMRSFKENWFESFFIKSSKDPKKKIYADFWKIFTYLPYKFFFKFFLSKIFKRFFRSQKRFESWAMFFAASYPILTSLKINKKWYDENTHEQFTVNLNMQ